MYYVLQKKQNTLNETDTNNVWCLDSLSVSISGHKCQFLLVSFRLVNSKSITNKQKNIMAKDKQTEGTEQKERLHAMDGIFIHC